MGLGGRCSHEQVIRVRMAYTLWACKEHRAGSSIINLAPMGNSQHIDDSVLVIYGIHNSVITNSKSPEVPKALELFHTRWPGFPSEHFDSREYAAEKRVIECLQLLLC